MATNETAIEVIRTDVALNRDVALLKMENDTMMAAAQAVPRDHETMLAELRHQVTTYPSFAGDAVYSKPVGKDPKTKKMKYARGLSVRAAEAVADVLGYNRVRKDAIPIDDDHVRLECSFVLFATGRVWTEAGPVSKYYTDRNKRRVRHTEDRFWNVVVKAEASKRIRECILRCAPPGLVAELENLVNEKLREQLDERATATIVESFDKQWKVSLAMLETLLGRPRVEWSQRDRITLLGLWNALEDGETSVGEAFGEQPTNSQEDVRERLTKTPEPEASAGVGPEVPPPTPVPQPQTDTAAADHTETIPISKPAVDEKPAGKDHPAYKEFHKLWMRIDSKWRAVMLQDANMALNFKLIGEVAQKSATEILRIRDEVKACVTRNEIPLKPEKDDPATPKS